MPSRAESQQAPGRRLHLHVGLPKAGSTYLQDILRRHRETLAGHGVSYPLLGRESMFRAALETAARPERFGLTPADVAGSFDAVIEEGRRSGAPEVVVSHEVFSKANTRQARAIAERLADFELHVVVVVRDPGALLVAEWQERVKNGDPASFADHAAKRFPGGTEASPARAAKVGSLLAGWAAVVPTDRIHVVTVPHAGAERSVLWRRFAEAIGLDPGVVDLRATDPGEVAANTSLGMEQVAFLRAVLGALDGRLGRRAHSLLVKRWLAQEVLGRQPGTRPQLPGALVAPLERVAEQWVADIVASGAVVHGDLDELRVSPGAGPDPDDVGGDLVAAAGAAAAADMLLEVRDLRRSVRRLRAEVRRLEGGSGAAR